MSDTKDIALYELGRKVFHGEVKISKQREYLSNLDSTWFGLCIPLPQRVYSCSNLEPPSAKSFKWWNKLLCLVTLFKLFFPNQPQLKHNLGLIEPRSVCGAWQWGKNLFSSELWEWIPYLPFMLMYAGLACAKKEGALWEGIGSVTKDLCNLNLSTKIEHRPNYISSNHTSSLEPLQMKPQAVNWNPCKSALIGLLSDSDLVFS